jgi:glycosyltransferase involved in cell wall biosynthesis
MASMNHIAINAQLLSGRTNYRSAGIHGYIYNLLKHLPDADPDFEYTVFVGEGRPAENARLHVRRTSLPTHIPTVRILWEQTVQPWLLRGFDLHHGLAFATPFFSRTPSVVTVYDLSFIHYPDRFHFSRRFYLRNLTRFTCRRARRVIAISQSTAQDIARVFDIPPDRVDVALPGVAPRFRPLPKGEVALFRMSRGLPESPFILYLGTIEPRKNLPVLLRAYARLPEPRPLLVLAGGFGWLYEDVFRTIEELDLQSDVHMPGYIPDDDLPLWYNAAKLFVYPSVYEGFGLTPLEALACGTPVVTSNVSSLPEAVGDAGMLVPPDDIEAWADAIARGLSDSAWREEASGRGRAWAEAFTWERTAEATVRCYRKVLKA